MSTERTWDAVVASVRQEQQDMLDSEFPAIVAKMFAERYGQDWQRTHQLEYEIAVERFRQQMQKILARQWATFEEHRAADFPAIH